MRLYARWHNDGDPMRPAYKNYQATIAWFFRDAILRQWRFGLLIFLSGMASTVSKIGAIWIVVSFVTKASNNQIIEFMGRQLDPRGSMTPLIIVSAMSASLYLFSAVFQYIERRATYASWGAHAEFCAARSLRALKDSDLIRSGCRQCVDPIAFQRLVNGYANTTGRVLSIALGGIAPLITLLFALVVMLGISPAITLALLGAMAVLVPVHAIVYIRAARASEASMTLAGAHAKALREFAAPFFAKNATTGESIDASQVPQPGIDARVDAMYSAGPIREYRDSYIKRFRCFAETELLIGITAAIAILVLVIGLGWWSLSHERGWGALLAYLITLQFAFGSVGGLIKRMASTNRFYPEVSAYFEFDRARRGFSVPMPNTDLDTAASLPDDLDDFSDIE